MRKCAGFHKDMNQMDAERINLIGTTLADLQARTGRSPEVSLTSMPKSERLRTVNAALEDPDGLERPEAGPGAGPEKKQLDDVVVHASTT